MIPIIFVRLLQGFPYTCRTTPSHADYQLFDSLHHDFLSLVALLAFEPLEHIV
jgi:hypothetical protein